ncbi:MAG: PAS domain S-box protein [Methylomonas sp.]|jgi:PAS domain S-box-containing protein
MQSDSAQKIEELRIRLEQELASLTDIVTGQLNTNEQRLSLELQVHQIELEMQNEALRLNQTLLETSSEEYRNRYVDLYDFAPVGYLTLNRENLITEINLTAASMLGIERKRLISQHFSQWIAKESQDYWRRQYQDLKQQGGKQSCELLMLRGDGSTFDAQLNCCCVTGNEQTSSVRLVLFDITERKRNERLFLKSQQRYAAIVESAMDGIITIDADQRILLFNSAAEKMFGYSADEVIGGTLERFIPDRFRHTHGLHLRAFEHTGSSNRKMGSMGQIMGLRADGEEFPVEVSISQTGMDGEKLFTAILRDISERKRMEDQLNESQRENQFLAGLIRSSTQPMAVGFPDGRIGLVNAAFEELTGYTAQELQSMNWATDLTPPEWSAIEQGKLAELQRAGQSMRYKKEYIRKNGARVPVELLVTLKTGSAELPEFYFAFVTDITERTEAERKIRETDRRKDVFLGMLAHELRNPLAPIRNAVEIQKLAINDPSRIAWCAKIINRQLELLTGLADDLQDVSLIKRGLVELKKEILEIRDFILPAVETNQPLIDNRGLEFNMTLPAEPIWVEGDRIRLVQVISNLINNAVKFTPEGGYIGLSADLTENKICLRVSDNGRGIDPADLSNLFDMFYQAGHNLDNSQGGLGVGLSIVHGLVKQHGGDVQAFSAGRGHGSEFVVCLPRHTMHKPTTADATVLTVPALKKLRILLVDDNPDVADSLSLLLKTEGHQVLTANDGPSALEIARAERPDVILLDIGLPGMNGYTVVQELRRNNELARTLLIALTGYGRPEDRKKSLAAGFDEHFVKSYDIEKLRKLINEYQIKS